MKKRVSQALSLMLIVVMLTTMIPLAAVADTSGVRSMDVCKTSAASMTLDGKVTDGEAWDLVSWSSDPFYTIGGTAAPAGSAVKFKSLWASDGDNAYLYFLINVSDNTLDSTGRGWNKDNVRVFLDEDGIGEDGDKCQLNKDNYGSLYASSEFMSYVSHSFQSKGFEYKTAKKAGDAGYVVEVRYTFQNAANATAGAEVRANLETVFGNSGNGVQCIWSKDANKWSSFSNKDYFAHAGTLKLTDKTAQKPTTSSMTVLRTNAAAMTVDGKVTTGEAWDKTEWSTQAFRQIGSEKVPAGSGIRFKTLWGTQDGKSYLFFLIDVNDDTLDATGRAWNQDNVRIFLDEDGIGEDNAKPVRNDANYGSLYASSEFMSYAPNTYASKGFEYGATKKEDGSGYFVEVRHTYQNAALAVADATVRANLTVVFANTEGNPAQFIWSWDSEKWSGGLKDKEYFGHAGTLKLSGTEVVSDEEKPKPPVTPSMSVEAKQTTVDAVKIDGKVDEKDVWDQVEWSDPAVAYKKQPIATEGSDAYQESYGKFGFRFKTLWATDGKKAYVYFLIDVSDSNLTSTKRAWASDNVRIFLDETGIAAEGTMAKLNRESAYASSEFMSYATVENSLGFKYRSKQKADGTGYVVEVQYTLSNPELASAGAKMKLNVVANDADSTNDDGSHYAQQFAWSWLSDLSEAYPQIDCIEHAGLLTLSGETVKREEQESDSGSGEDTNPPTPGSEEQPGTETTGPDSASTTDAGTAPAASGCASAVGMTGFGLLMLLAAAPMLLRRRKED